MSSAGRRISEIVAGKPGELAASQPHAPERLCHRSPVRPRGGIVRSFVAQLRKHIPRATLTPGNVSVTTPRSGNDRMTFGFPEKRSLNGKTVDLTSYRLFEGPFLNADVGSEQLTMTYKGLKRTLDFKKVTITE